MASLPPPGTPIVVTTTSNSTGEVGKFFGTYSPERDYDDPDHPEIFVLRPLPGKYFIDQLPMYKNQEHGWQYAYPPAEGKEGVDPQQELVKLVGIDRMQFPGGVNRNDPFTWTLLEADPHMRVHDNLPEGIRMEISRILQTDGDRLVQLGQLANKYPPYKGNILKVVRSEKKLREILGEELSAYGKVSELKQLRLIVPHFKEHIEQALSVLEPIAEVRRSKTNSQDQFRSLVSMMSAQPAHKEVFKRELEGVRREPTRRVQESITAIVRGPRQNMGTRRLALYHLAESDDEHRMFKPAIMRELRTSNIVETLGEQAEEIAAIFGSHDLETVLPQLVEAAHKYPHHKDTIDELVVAAIEDEIDYIDRKSKEDTSTKGKKLGALATLLNQQYPNYMNRLIHMNRKYQPMTVKELLYKRIREKVSKTRSGGRKRRKTRRKSVNYL